ESVPLRELFAHGSFREWQLLEADSFERVRFVLQHNPCDVVLLDGKLQQREGPGGLAWLTRQQVPVILVADALAETLADALQHGVHQWLPRSAVLRYPPLLAAALHQAGQVNGLRGQVSESGAALQDCRRQVDRLVGLLWRTLPTDVLTRWLTQRHMLE